jgi:hypothetical protein
MDARLMKGTLSTPMANPFLFGKQAKISPTLGQLGFQKQLVEITTKIGAGRQFLPIAWVYYAAILVCANGWALHQRQDMVSPITLQSK